MNKTRKLLISILSITFALCMFMCVACSKENIEIKTVPPVVQHRVGESINCYDYVERQAGVTYTFAMAFEDGEAEELAANGYYLSEVGNYTLTINAKKGKSSASASITFSVIEVAPTLWSIESELSSSWLSYTLLYKLLDEAGPFAMPIDGVEMELTHVFVYPAEDDTYGYKVDLTGTQSYVEEFKTANPDELTPIEINEENVEDLGFYVKRRKLKDDQSAIKASDGKYYGEKEMAGIFKFLIEGQYEFHYRAYNGGGEEKSRFFVKCTEKLSDLTEIEGGLTFNRDTFIATWKPVPGAVQYKVKLLNKNYFIEDTTFDCSDIITNRIMDFTLVVLPIGEKQETPNDYVNDSKMTYETPYLGSTGTTLNEDGSITMRGANPPGELYLNIAGVENDYYALRGDFGVGNYIDIVYKGNNMPTVLLFADEINGQLSYQGGRGIAVVNGLHSSTEGGVKYPGSTNIYGPNRINTHYSYSPIGRLDAAFSQSKTDENITYKYTLGTRLDSDNQLVVCASLYNYETGKLIAANETTLYYWYDATRDPKKLANPRNLNVDDVTAGDIVLYAPWKEGAADTTFISVSDPYYIDPRAVIENEDGSVSLYSQIPGGVLYSSFNGTSNSYVAHEGAYDVGTFVDFEFKGNNMPSVMFFADEVNSIMGFKGGKGIVAVSGLVTREYLDNPYNAETDSGVKPSDGAVKVFGPNRVNMHYSYSHLATYGGEFAPSTLKLNPDRNYKYTVGTRVDDEGYIRWVAELYDADTNEMLGNADVRLYHQYDMEIPNDPNTPETEWDIENRYLTPADVTAGSIVAYAQFKGTTEERTTFKMSEPYYPDTTISKGNASQNEDDSYTAKGFYPAASTYTSLSNTTLGYVAHNGKYGVGTFAEYTFTGNNMPQVMLFASDMSMDLSSNAKREGILILNGFKTSANETTDRQTNRLYVFGPNRMDQPLSFGMALCSKVGSKLAQAQLDANTNYRYVVGTKAVIEDVNLFTAVDGDLRGQDGYAEEVIHLILELYNADTGELIESIDTKLDYQFSQGMGYVGNKPVRRYLTTSDVNDGHIVAYAGLKGLDADNKPITTTFTVSKKPYTLEADGEEHVHEFVTYANDGTYHWVECECGVKFDKTPCAGGEATCTELATCETCEFKYGEFKPHTGGTATCYEAATCEACGNKYGTFGHDYTTATEGSIVIDGDYHSYHCGKCDNDAEKELHFGGEATYDELAKCIVCGAGHGDYLDPASNDEVTLINIKETDSVEFNGKRKLTADSGSLTFSADGASAIAIIGADASDFIKLNFTATGDAVESMAIRFRQSSAVANWQSGWGIVPNGSHGMMLNYGGNYYMNRINGHGKYTSVIGGNSVEAKSDFTAGNEYAYMFGIVGSGENKVLHFAIVDETNGTIMRYVTWTWAQILEYAGTTNKNLSDKAIADTGYYVIDFTAAVENKTISYQTMSAGEAIYTMNGSKPLEITGYERSNITWTAIEGAVSYAVKVDDGDWTNVGNVTNYVVPNLVEGEEYTAQVKAIFEKTESKAGELTFIYSSHVHEFNTKKFDADYHWYVCSCTQETEKVAHYGGTATTSAQAVCEGCGESYGSTVIPSDVTVINIDKFIANGGVAPTATKGNVTFTASAGAANGNTATIVLNGAYTNEFVKVGFTALESGAGRTYMPDKTIGLTVGVRGVSTANNLLNYSMSPWGNTNWLYMTGNYGTISHLGGLTNRVTNKHWDNIVKGETYYIVVGIVGSDYNKSTATTDDDAVFYWMLLDKDDSVRAYVYVTAEELLSKKSTATIRESGVFTIHNIAGGERTLTYEVIDSATALGYIGK